MGSTGEDGCTGIPSPASQLPSTTQTRPHQTAGCLSITSSCYSVLLLLLLYNLWHALTFIGWNAVFALLFPWGLWKPEEPDPGFAQCKNPPPHLCSFSSLQEGFITDLSSKTPHCSSGKIQRERWNSLLHSVGGENYNTREPMEQRDADNMQTAHDFHIENALFHRSTNIGVQRDKILTFPLNSIALISSSLNFLIISLTILFTNRESSLIYHLPSLLIMNIVHIKEKQADIFLVNLHKDADRS